MVRFLQWVAAAAAACMTAVSGQSDFPLCGLVPDTYATAASTYPQYKPMLAALSNVTVASWYTDNDATAYTKMQKLLNKCKEDTLPVIIIYGLPMKDCHAGESTATSPSVNRDADSYAKWIQQLAELVDKRPVIYIVEPDAIGLALNTECGKTMGYVDAMAKAIPVLSDNDNALLYVDVGYWMMGSETNQTLVAEVLKQFSATGRVNGIALDTSNYRTNKEMAEQCDNFATLTKNKYKCIIDTSRNYRGPKEGTGAWCNSRYAGLGVPSTNNTQNDNIDYFLYLKTPGESDGACVGQDSDSLTGGGTPGSFFAKAFSLMWDRGYFVDVLKMAPLNEYTDNVDLPTDSGNTSYLALGIVIAVCVVFVVVGVLLKRRHDAKQGRRRYANNNAVAAPQTNEAGSRKPYLSL